MQYLLSCNISYFIFLTMNATTLGKNYKYLLAITTLIAVIASLFAIMHWPGKTMLLIITLILQLLIIIISLREIYSSQSFSTVDKTGWTVAFLFVCMISAYLYYFFTRPHFIDEIIGDNE